MSQPQTLDSELQIRLIAQIYTSDIWHRDISEIAIWLGCSSVINSFPMHLPTVTVTVPAHKAYAIAATLSSAHLHLTKEEQSQLWKLLNQLHPGLIREF